MISNMFNIDKKLLNEKQFQFKEDAFFCLLHQAFKKKNSGDFSGIIITEKQFLVQSNFIL